MPGEAGAISALSRIEGGYIHLRKPDAAPEQLEAWIRELLDAGADRECLTVHHNAGLAVKYSLGGVHFRYGDFHERVSLPGNIRRSVSCHSWSEVSDVADNADYLFLSPVFDSVSKPDYKGAVDITDAFERLSSTDTCTDAGACVGRKVVALGGVTACNLRIVRDAGFTGAAMLGAAWKFRADGSLDAEATTAYYGESLKQWRLSACRFQFISDGDLCTARAYLEGGGRWIQLRMKDTPPVEVVARGKEMLELCAEYDAVFIVNDDPLVAVECGAHGVHLGKGDMCPAEARKILGDNKIIGVTANTLDDIVRLGGKKFGGMGFGAIPVDYIGLGPYRFTETKKNLSPVLGIEGYKNIMNDLCACGISTPVVAIGGIRCDDIEGLMSTGVAGIAVSGTISSAADPCEESRNFSEKLRNCVNLSPD